MDGERTPVKDGYNPLANILRWPVAGKDGFVSKGLLEVKGAATLVDLHFSVEYDEGDIFLDGTARL